MKERTERGRIEALKNDHGHMITEEAEVVKLVLEFYHKLLGTHAAILQGINLTVMRRGPILAHEDYIFLTRVVYTQEID